MNRVLRCAAIAAALTLSTVPFVAKPAFAGTATQGITVTTTITNNCTISSPSAVTFTAFNGAANTTSASAVAVLCTTGDAWTISANTGLNNAHAVGTTRAMNNGTTYISYELYIDSGYANVWNGTNVFSGTGNGATQTQTVYGKIPAQVVPAANTYSDTVTATVTF